MQTFLFAIVAACLIIAIGLIAIQAISIKNAVKSHDGGINIPLAVTDLMMRIVLFVLYYILLIIIGIALFFGAFYVSKLTWWAVTSFYLGHPYVYVLVVVANIAVWLLAAMTGIYLIKPLFMFSSNTKPERIEVNEQNCPELLKMIRETAAATRCKIPKHVYLTHEANACVFYNTTFWSLFFPVSKNIEIGLGLMDGLNVSELKAVIGHEFGHFAQDSMRAGSAAYFANSVLYNLIYTQDWWDGLVNHMKLSDLRSIRAAGHISSGIANIVRRNTFRMYRFVQKSYRRLSRHMEYDADRVACQAIGSKALISALCKLDLVEYNEYNFNIFIKELYEQNKFMSDYWAAYTLVTQIIPRYGRPQPLPNVILSTPFTQVASKVKVKNIWQTHPSVPDRIAHASGINPDTPIDTTSAWTLITDDIKNQMSEHLFNICQQANPNIEKISDEEFRQFAEKKNGQYMREDLEPFFDHPIIPFDLNATNTGAPHSNPFTDENRNKLEELKVLFNDNQTLTNVYNGNIEAEEILYNNQVIKRENIPVDEITAQFEETLKTIREIDQSVYAYLHQHSDDEQCQALERLYQAIDYVNHLVNEVLPQYQQQRNNLVVELNDIKRRDEQEFNELVYQITRFGSATKKLIRELDYNYMPLLVQQQWIENWDKYATDFHSVLNSGGNAVNTQNLNYLIQTADSIIYAIEQGNNTISNRVYEIALQIVPPPAEVNA